MARAVAAARAAGPPPPEVGSWEDVIAGHGGTEVPVRVYRPAHRNGKLATALFFHGGGFVLGSIDLADEIARKLCRDTGAVVVSVGYRLAPEAPFPAAHEDALAAALWALQVLIAPGLDMARDAAALDVPGRTYPMLTTGDLRDIARLAMGARAEEAASCPPSPARAASLAGVAPALIAVAGHDPLEAEGLAFARRLEDAAVPVATLQFADMFHPFLGFFAHSPGARRATDRICAEIVRNLGQTAPMQVSR